MSPSVPLAIILLKNIQVAGSKSNKAVSEFILLMADLFDIIESRSNFGKYTEALRLGKFNDIEEYLMGAIETPKFLKDTAGIPTIKGQK